MLSRAPASTLLLTSAADRPVLLLDGEELIGAKQNRVLNTTVLIAADMVPLRHRRG